jgi:DNA-binding Lrp family transcriptional regulator
VKLVGIEHVGVGSDADLNGYDDMPRDQRCDRAGRLGARPLHSGKFAALEAAVQKLPVVLDCYLVAGDCDYFLKVRVRDLQDFNGD